MTKVRQLPDIYIRGAIANETMKNLTPAQRAYAEEVCDMVADHEVLTGHKNMFMNQLGRTIRCDYADRIAAAQEYRITIWRGVIYLLYHREYSYRCKACNATSYQSQRGATIKFDRRWNCCPACKSYAIDDPGDSGLEPDSFITESEYEQLLLDLASQGRHGPKVKSCIKPIPGKKKVPNPYKVLADPAQLKKFFGEFIWNYFRQNIKENKVTHHGKKTHILVGPVDTVAVQAITQLLKVNAINYQCDPYSPVDGYFAIYCQPYGIDPEIFLEILEIKEFVQLHGGDVKVDGADIGFTLDNAILVKDLYGSAELVELATATNDQVQVVTNSMPKDDGDDHDIVQQLEKQNMRDMQVIEQNDRISALREALPEGDCRHVLDLITNQGEVFDRFAEMYPDDVMANKGVPRQNRMAEFLGCSAKAIKQYRTTIQIQALAHGIVPEG